jgi:hypothetical protein
MDALRHARTALILVAFAIAPGYGAAQAGTTASAKPAAAPERVLSPVDAAKAQLEAYNRRDLDAFVALFSDDVTVYREPNREPAIRGKAAFTEAYRKRFQTVGLRAEILNRIEVGNKVTEHERVYGIQAHPVELIVVYEVIDGKIRNVWFFSADPST